MYLCLKTKLVVYSKMQIIQPAPLEFSAYNTGVGKSQVAKDHMVVARTEMPCRFLENLCTPEVWPVQTSEKITVLKVAGFQYIMG
jgi:hypothetical protein